MNEGTAVVKRENPIERLKQYDGKPEYCLTLPLDGQINISPYITMDLIVVKIDPRDVSAGGEVHDMQGAFMPAAPAVFRLCDAWGIQIDAEKSETAIIEPYHWCTKVSGRRRNPDGSWRASYAEYEFDANLRGEEMRIKMRKKGKPESTIQKILFDFKNHGRTRCVTGAELALIGKLTGMKKAFKTREELQVNFVAYRFVDDVAAISRDPAMRKGLIENGNRAANEIYGQPRDVTPVVVKNGVMIDEPTEEVPAEFADLSDTIDKPAEDDALTTARDNLEDWLQSEVLPVGPKGLIQAMLDNEDATLDAVNDLINRCKLYVERVKGGAK